MPRSDVYRRRARDCGVLADAASDLEGRQYYLQLALVWNDMARADEAMVSQENSATNWMIDLRTTAMQHPAVGE